MKMNNLFMVAACAAVFTSCAATVPMELVNAREAYRRASSGPAGQVALAELHVAGEALAQAEQSFKQNPGSYQTRDLAYVAERKSELATATASITIEQKSQSQANSDFEATQGKIVKDTKQDLKQTRTALAESQYSGAVTAVALASSERSGAATAELLSAEQVARNAADLRTANALAALAKLGAVKEEPRGMVITLSGSVLFASNQAILLPEARTRLDQVVAVLLTTRERNLTIEGHTDSQGTDAHNLDLSQRRADAVRNYLVTKGYEADRIQAHGLGEGHPIADNANAEGRANNRRVEIVIAREMQHASNP
jgi:outer membrane protein OmpA-like peptidoglycan-associated protein